MRLTPTQRAILSTTDGWRADGSYPFFPVLAEGGTTRGRLADGRAVTMFGSADYLGLGRHPEVLDAATDAVRRYGAGTYGAQVATGFTELHRDLQDAIAAFYQRPDALLFPSGMQANQGAIAGLLGVGDLVLTDRLNHGSISMGAGLSGARVVTFRHNDTDHLADLLAGTPTAGNRLIVVDGLFSADGDYPPLATIADLADRYDAILMVDEAHSALAVGATGRGAAEAAGVLDRVDLITGTMSKAFGSVGGFAVGDPTIIRILRHTATAYLLSLGPSPATVAAGLAALRLAGTEGRTRRRALADNAARLRSGLRAAGADIGATESHVVPVLVGPVERTVRMASWLVGHGLLTNPLVPPAVPIGGARLRLGVLSEHTPDDLATACRLVAEALAAVPVSSGKVTDGAR